MNRLKLAFASLGVLSAVLIGASPVFAGSPGQLAQGDKLYEIKNLTQGGNYAKSISTACGDTVQFSMELANTGFGQLDNVTLTASLPSAGGTSNAVATTSLGGDSGTHDSLTFSVPSGATLVYENGTTMLYDGNGNVIRTLPDTITSGVNVGTINGSTTEFVNFKAKVSCPEKPPVTPPTPTPKPTPAPKPTSLPNTGPEGALEVFGGTTLFGSLGHYLFRRRR